MPTSIDYLRDSALSLKTPIKKAKTEFMTSGADFSATGADNTTGADFNATGADFNATGADFNAAGAGFNATGSSSNTNKGKAHSIRTDKKLNQMIKDIQNCLCMVSLSKCQIIQLAIKYTVNSDCVNKDLGEQVTTSIINKPNENFKKDGKISFRISNEFESSLKRIYHTEELTFAINCCLIDFYNHIKTLSQYTAKNLSSDNQKLLELDEYLFSRPGLKKRKLLYIITQTIEEIRIKCKCDTYIEPFTGTANVLLHLITKFNNEEINDSDKDIINLLYVIQNHYDKFIANLLSYPVNKNVYDILNESPNNANKTHNNNSSERKYEKKKIDNAVKYFYTILLSYYGKRDSIKKGVNDETLLKKAIILSKVSQRLKNTKITKNNAFYFFNNKIIDREITELKKSLLYLDPPYIGTEYYYYVEKKEPAKEVHKATFHKELKDIILLLKNKGATIVISYRATVTLKNKYKMTSERVQEILDELYMNQGFFIQFTKITHRTKINGEYIPDNQIEILLSSVEVSGSVPYDCRISDLIEKHVK